MEKFMKLFKKKKLVIPSDKEKEFLRLSVEHGKAKKRNGSVGAHMEYLALWGFVAEIFPETTKGAWQLIYPASPGNPPYAKKL